MAGIKTVELIPSGGGAFEIRVDDALLHSKLQTGEWPDFDAMAAAVKKKLAKK